MAVSPIPKDLAAAIRKCWPGGEVEEFATDESYFHDVRPRIERDLRKIPGASLRWQTEDGESLAAWDSDRDAEPSPPDDDFASYHLFFLSPEGAEFHFEDETEGMEEEPEDPDEEETSPQLYAGEGWIGCAVAVSLVAPFALTNWCRFCHYEDGSLWTPEAESFIYSDKTGERVDTDSYHREFLGEKAYQKLEKLRDRIGAVLAKHGVRLLDNAVLDLPVPRLQAASELFLDERLRVRDAFFFQGV